VTAAWRARRELKALKLYVCPKCFTQWPEPDTRGNCPACVHSTDGANVLLRFSLAVLLIALLLVILGTLYILGLSF
jgi:hypothetical protein